MAPKTIVFEIIAGGFWLLALVYSVLMLVDPVRASELERKYWWRGQDFVMRPNPEELAASARKRLSARLGAAALISVLLLIGYVIHT